MPAKTEPRLILLALAALILGGCARRETAADAGIRDKTLLLGNGAEPEDLDPQIVTAYTDQNILLALFEGLTAIDERTSQAVPAAAASWESSPNGLSWTFHLRPGLRWSDGDALTAGDFAASWRRMLSPSLAAQYAYLLYPIRGAEAFAQGKSADPASLGIEAPDTRTVRIILSRRTPYLPVLVALPPWYPIDPRVLAKFGAMGRRGTKWTRPGNLVGNGPFVLESWEPGARIAVSRNPRYWDAGRVGLNRIVFFPTDNPQSEERDFRSGQLHVTYAVPIPRMGYYRANRPGVLRVDPFLQSFFLRFNVTKAPFSDWRVRRALSLAVDRDRIAQKVLSGAYPAAHSLTPPDCGGYTARASVGLDLPQARRLLAEAGFPGGRGLRPFDVQLRNDGVQEPVMEAIQEMWAKGLGVHARLAPLEQKTWIQDQQTLGYAVSTASWAGDFLDPVTFLDLFTSHGGNNWTGWGDPAYDALIAQAADEADAGRRLQIFQRAEDLLLGRGPVAPLYFGAHAYLISPAVHGWEPALLGYHRYADVTLGP